MAAIWLYSQNRRWIINIMADQPILGTDDEHPETAVGKFPIELPFPALRCKTPRTAVNPTLETTTDYDHV
ncbi:hypothetical protein O9K51_10324 [Purpureocillium lavendulum]|uniref:Uncharacterized protein n=1 Tax=Purpureocillium lavendulum TaxID=1247861 RepID=A0AB34FEU5_9HYPO|nr:hypothetical protein O9K51_10324 [Purpureocillium lavendulum]